MSKLNFPKVFVPVAVFFVLIAGYIGLYLYTNHIQNLTAGLEQEILKADQLHRQENSLQLLSNDIQPDLDVLSSTIISKEGDIAFIKELEDLEKMQGIDLQIISASETEGDKFNQLLFRITIEGGWSKVLQTVQLVEAMPYRLSVEQVDLNLLDDVGATVKSKAPRQWRAAMQFSVLKEK